MLLNERDTTGRWWSSHPLDEYRDLVEVFGSHNTRSVRECPEGTDVTIGGVLLDLQERIIRSGRNEGKRMARFRIADEQGAIEGVIFSEAFQRYREKLADNRTLFFAGDVDASREEVCVRVHGVYRPREAPHELAGMVQIHLPEQAPLGDLRELLGHYHGERPVLLTLQAGPGLGLTIRAGETLGVDPTQEFVAEVRSLVGETNVRILPAAPGARRERRRRRRNGY